MRIWLINHYAVPPKYYPLARPSQFAKNLAKMGHEVTIIAASTIHNSESKNLIDGKEKVKHLTDDGIPYVLINCTAYEGNGIKRIRNIWEFSRRLSGVLDGIEERPDVIIATSFDPFTCYEGIKYAKKHGIKAIAEIADLWPETLVSYCGLSKRNPIVSFLRHIEKKIYLISDSIIFTMEGAYDYILDQGWEKDIPKSKVHYINNGVDLDLFRYNAAHYQTNDEDLADSKVFKIVYTGSIRKVNNVGILLDAAKELVGQEIKILIWGDGDELNYLRARKEEEKIENVVFKGRVEKKDIPYILCNSDATFLDVFDDRISKYGVSPNKLFEYFASGKPVLMNKMSKYNPAAPFGCCVMYDTSAKGVADAIYGLYKMEKEDYINICNQALIAAKAYSYETLTKMLLEIIEE